MRRTTRLIPSHTILGVCFDVHSKITLDSRIRRCSVCIHERGDDGLRLCGRPRHRSSCALLRGQLLQRTIGLQVREPCVQGSKLVQGSGLQGSVLAAVQRTARIYDTKVTQPEIQPAALPAEALQNSVLLEFGDQSMPGTTVASFTGFGLGLRTPHYQEFLGGDVSVDFVEVISENFMVQGGRPLNVLAAVRERYPVAMHGVSMSIGSADGVKLDYLIRLKALADRVQPLWVSDHLCWTGIEGFNSHDLLPLPYTEDAMRIVCANILLAQDVLERPLLLENPSTYMSFADDEMSESAFLSEMCRRTGCYLLLDVNNIYVSASNHGFDPLWSLYQTACARFTGVATMIERDDDIPPLSDLLAELDLARALAAAWQRAA